MNVLTEYLSTNYDEIEPIDFYRFIFPQGELQEKGVFEQGKYNGIIVEVERGNKKYRKGQKEKVMRHTLTDDLDKLKEVIERDNFCLMAPISYIGKARKSENARIMYAMAIDLDSLQIKEDGTPVGLTDLFHQFNKAKYLPKPTFIVSSGTGLHLYYVFEKPIRLFPHVVEQFQKYKRELTRMIWNGFVTKLEDNVQYESLFQGFRVVGTMTKKGTRARAFVIGNRVTMDYMNSFMFDEFKTDDLVYKSNLSLEQAKEKYPEWYEKRIEKKQPRGTWVCNRALYDWWKREIFKQAKTGHRYFCMMMLAIYARKSGIEKEELEKDAFELMEVFEKKTDSEDNHFDEGDVIDALQAYDDRFITFPINSISYLTDISIQRNRRNGRKQEQHLKLARFARDLNYEDEYGWINRNGRPKGAGTKQEIIQEWRKNNPKGTKKECKEQTGLTYPTIRKWWDES